MIPQQAEALRHLFLNLQMIVCCIFSAISALGWAYEAGRRSELRRCRKMLDDSRVWHAMHMAALKMELRPWLGNKEPRA